MRFDLSRFQYIFRDLSALKDNYYAIYDVINMWYEQLSIETCKLTEKQYIIELYLTNERIPTEDVQDFNTHIKISILNTKVKNYRIFI